MGISKKPFSFRRLAIMVVIVVVLLYIGACAFLYVKQRSMLFRPTPGRAPAEAKSLSIENEGVALKIWTRQVDSPNAVIYFGGNAEDVGLRLDDLAKSLPEHNLFLVNYRGYGGNSGEPSEAAFFSDALAVYDSVKSTATNVTVIGRSLGSGVAVYLASNRPVDRLVLITPYDSIENVAKSHYPIFPISLLLVDKFDSATRVKDISAPTLVLLADNDSVIPRNRSQALIDRFRPGQTEVTVIAGSNHGSIGQASACYEQLSRFLKPNHQ